MVVNKPSLPKGRKPAPVCVRVTAEERALLCHAAGEMNVSQYIRRKLFQESGAETMATEALPARLSEASRLRLLAQILSGLSSSNIAGSLNTLGSALTN
jgi:hypothetical protein